MHPLKRNRAGRIAVIELVILALLFALAAGTAIPTIKERTLSGERARALGDLRRMSGDLLNYQHDTGTWPGGCDYAFTDGDEAHGETAAAGGRDSRHASEFLAMNKPPVKNWRGPYMSVSRPDPWGHRYIVLLDGLNRRTSSSGWVLSAGPDGVFQTTRSDEGLEGDDLGLRLH